MTLALFDLDKTLLNGDSDFEWGQFLVSKNLVDQKEYAEANSYFYEEYKRGTLDIVEFCAFSFKPLSVMSRTQLNELHNEFMQTVIIPMIRKKSQATVDKHHAQGDISILITATNSFITQPIANYFGIQHLIATEPKIVDGKYTTEIEGTPCFQEGKVTRLHEWMDENDANLKGSYLYSDSMNDIPLLEAVETAIAVHPDDTLKEIAEERGWAIISL
ncbi:MAG: HAD superfamily hydrolase (TIGR01490 family) [Cocleimonas sp.]|jgi:HAD superfamily hydrolase (TIGR01490 family)